MANYSLSDIWNWVVQNLTWSFIVRVLLMSAFITAALNRAFGLLENWKKQLWFFGAAVLLIGATAWALDDLRPRAKFQALITYLGTTLGPPGGAILTASIINAGSAQSVAMSFQLKTTIDGRDYFGIPATVPANVQFIVGNQKYTYHSSDSLVTKASSPIPQGGEVNGIALFVFPTIPPALLARPATFYFTFKDAFGESYNASIDTTGNMVPPTVDLPGITAIAPTTLTPPASAAPPQSK
ncbi:hypothetical protein [uncultured Methylovirgula sp.]|uniref:hypothetical protein n=1 Tax=uncultured Methylovirgula sp. TaxID=1285960 RepID=UPI002635BDB7|nr:hypothetical protein [uncultured Methylovirgula sp.]